MAISPSQIRFGPANSGTTYTSGALHNVFGSGVVGSAQDYRLVEVRNTSDLTWTSPVAWLAVDAGGASVALAVADGIARDLSHSYSVDATALSYSTPTTAATGLALPTLAAGQKCLLALRRTLAGASPDYPDNNTLHVKGSSPA